MTHIMNSDELAEPSDDKLRRALFHGGLELERGEERKVSRDQNVFPYKARANGVTSSTMLFLTLNNI